MTILRRALDRAQHDDCGTSLVELMVVIILLTLVLGATASTMILGQRQAGSSSIRLDNTAQARIGMEALTKLLHTAVSPSQLVQSGQTCVGANCPTALLSAAGASSIAFVANVDNDLSTSIGPSLVTYSVVQDPVKLWGNLVESVQAPLFNAPGSYKFCTPAPGCSVRSRVIARGLLWPIPAVTATTPALFTYYNASDAVVGPVPLSAANQLLVDSIDVQLQVRTSSVYGTPSTTFVQRIVLTNTSLD